MTGAGLDLCIRVVSAPPGVVPKEGETYVQRLVSTSRADYKVDRETGCWVWQKNLNRQGYPQGRRAHHVYWSLANGCPVPNGHHIHHLCRNRACVNPEHLELLTAHEHAERHAIERTGLTRERIEELLEAAKNPELTYLAMQDMFGADRQTIMRLIRGIHRHGRVVEPEPRHCLYCGVEFTGRRNKRYCTATHRKNANHRALAMRRDAA